MSKNTAGMQSWQVFHFCRKHLGASVLYKIFGKKKARAIDRWCEDPRYTAKEPAAYDPIRGVKNLLSILDDHGHSGIVRAAAAYLCEGTCCDMDMEPTVVEPMPSITDEILADYRAVSNMQKAIEQRLDVAGVEHLMLDAIAEIERTFARYQKDYTGE